METLKRVIVVLGPKNVGKSTVVSLASLRLLNEPVYNFLLQHNGNLPQQLIGWMTHNERRSLVQCYGAGRKMGKVAFCAKGDTPELIKDAFEFAEDTRARLLVLACREDARENKPHAYLDLIVGTYAFTESPDIVRINPSTMVPGTISGAVLNAVNAVWQSIR